MVTDVTPILLNEVGARAYLGGMSRDKLYKLVRTGEIKAIHIGRSLRFSVQDLTDYVVRLRQGPQ